MFLQVKPSGAALCGASASGRDAFCVFDVPDAHTALCCIICVSHVAFLRKLVLLCWKSNGELLTGCRSVFFFFFNVGLMFIVCVVNFSFKIYIFFVQ